MYQIGDLLWIPAGALLIRKKNKDDNLFSNMWKTDKPQIGIFKEHRDNDWSEVLVNNVVFSVENKDIKHHVERAYAN